MHRGLRVHRWRAPKEVKDDAEGEPGGAAGLCRRVQALCAGDCSQVVVVAFK